MAARLLSGGEQQMLKIGRGLMANPHLLMVDEPSIGLAPLIVESVYETSANFGIQDSPFCSPSKTHCVPCSWPTAAILFRREESFWRGNR